MGRHKFSREDKEKDFLELVDKENGPFPKNASVGRCWLYKGKVSEKNPYGAIRDFYGKIVGAHVMAIEVFSGGEQVPKGFKVHHRIEEGDCTSKRCVRFPGHTEIVRNHDALSKRGKIISHDPIISHDKEEDGHVHVTPQLHDFLRRHLYARALQREAKERAQILIQEDREEPFFVKPWMEEEVLDPLGEKGVPCRIKRHLTVLCGWEVLERFEKGEWHGYTFLESVRRYVPHRMVCPARTRTYSMEEFDDSWKLLNLPPKGAE